MKLGYSLACNSVIPAKAGIQTVKKNPATRDSITIVSATRTLFFCWIPAFAGIMSDRIV
jgi:hypothetical protein